MKSLVFQSVILLAIAGFQADTCTAPANEYLSRNAEAFAKCIFFNPGITGEVRLRQAGNDLEYRVLLWGLSAGEHGFHVHEYGDVSLNRDLVGCQNIGGHYNPTGQSHGYPDDVERHVADLGNICLEDGKDYINTTFVDSVTSLIGDQSILGRSLAVHEGRDDGTGASGNAGAIIACCTINLASDWTDTEYYRTKTGLVIGGTSVCQPFVVTFALSLTSILLMIA